MSKRRCMVLFFATQFVHLYGPLVRSLRDHHSMDTVLVVLGRSRLPRDPGAVGLDLEDFKEIVDIEPCLAPQPADDLPSPAELSAQAARVEKEFDVSVIELLRSDRHLGIDYVTGAVFPRSHYGTSFSHPQAVYLTVQILDFCAGLLERHKPDVVFCSSGSLPTSALAEVARSRDVPVRFLVKGRMAEQHFHWSTDRHARWWGLAGAYLSRLRTKAGGAAEQVPSPVEMDMPFRMKEAVVRLRCSLGIAPLVREVGLLLARTAWHRLSGRAGKYGNYRTGENVKLLAGRWRARRAMLRERPLLPELADDLPFVFFPLQTEPESNLFAEVPECDNQLTVIDWLAKTVPGGWYVVVKEHPALTAPRPSHFWPRIKEYPNVLVAGTHESADAFMNRARAMAMINATLGYQAALRGIPVVCFMANYNGVLMPHVRYADSYGSTHAALRDVAEEKLPAMKSRLTAAAAFSAAIEDCALDINDRAIRLGVVGNSPVDDDDARRIADHLVMTLRREVPPECTQRTKKSLEEASR